MALNAMEGAERLHWIKFLEGKWQVVRFYTNKNVHHMLLRCSESKKQLNLNSGTGYFQGLAESDYITLEPNGNFPSDPEHSSDEFGFSVSWFKIKTVN